MTSIQPELWLDTPREALTFYEAAFGATVLQPSTLVTPPGGRFGAGDLPGRNEG
jgi:uncharacterized glyoxalase superfamily protein PhnB